MVIQWSLSALYNTIMSVAAGVALLLVVKFFSDLYKSKIGQLEGWSLGFAIPGFILTLTGAHMSLTAPLSKVGFPFDDIIFGEPCLAFGVLLLAVSILLWKKSNRYVQQGINMDDTELVSETLQKELPYLIKPLSYFGAAMGLGLISIAFAGVGSSTYWQHHHKNRFQELLQIIQCLKLHLFLVYMPLQVSEQLIPIPTKSKS